MNDDDAIDGDEVKDDVPGASPELALELRHPGIPATVDQMAALGPQGVTVVKARHQVLQTLRAASIQTTYPEDWLLFRGRDGEINCYLQDAGCDRIAPLWGIEVFDIQEPVRIPAEDGSFCWVQIGSGRCALTGQTVEKMEGMRASTDDIAKDLKGAKQEYIVRKSARANLDGSILRELSGFKNVPIGELKSVAPDRDWEGRGKKGRGFGSSTQRAQDRQGEVDLTSPVPNCPKCGGPMWDNRLDKRNPNAPDFKCKKKGSDPNCDGAQWLPKKAPAPAPPPQQTNVSPPSPASAPPPAQPTQTTAPSPGPTAVPSGGANQDEEEVRMRRIIRSQIKGLRWDSTKQAEFFGEYAEAANLPAGATIDQFKLTMLREIHEDLKRGEAS